MGTRVLIVGGVAGGASCAARLRRVDERAEIVIFERGPFVSFANCGLPYYVGNVIAEEKELLQATPQLFKKRFNIETRLMHEVVKIDRTRNEIEVKNLSDGAITRERYDFLVLSPGASPVKPPLSGIDLPGIFTVRSIPDSNAIKEWAARKGTKRTLVIGAGFIGVEMAENLRELGMEVTLVEMADQLMPLFDREMTYDMRERMKERGVTLVLGDSVASFKTAGDGVLAQLTSGKSVTGGLAILSIGVKPDSDLAVSAGLMTGPRGHIRVDDRMRTSDQRIFAVGDAVEVKDFITGAATAVPLAGPANRQGRIAADVIAGRNARFRGVQGTAVVGAFGMTLAMTGHSEKTLKRQGITDYATIWAHGRDHAAYYPGATFVRSKLLFSTKDGSILGYQATGEKGVEKRVDVISAFMQKNGTVYDLEEAELSYAPQFGSAKDVVNMLGFIAANFLKGDGPTADWNTFEDEVKKGALLVDVREPGEFANGTIPGAVNMPLSTLRDKLSELPKEKEIIVFCQVGQRGYVACRLLNENGYKSKNLSGGYSTYVRMQK